MADPFAPFAPPPETAAGHSDPLAVDARRLAKLLGLGLRTIRTMDAGGKLPTPFRCGTRKLWDVSEVKAWMKAGAPDRETWELLKKSAR